MGVYEKLGVRPLINATCHWTLYGGSVMWPDVIDAMADARKTCVNMRDLLDAASKVITGYTKAEAALVVSGCAAGLQAGAAAIMTGDDKTKMEALPHAEAFANEFIAYRFPRQRDGQGREYTHWGYAQAVRGAGGVFVEIGDDEGVTQGQLEAALGPKTAGVYWLSDGTPGVPIEEVVQIAHQHGVPVLVDAANTLPPEEHLHRFTDLGADLVSFSGGKGLRGPQGSGILTGRADLIASARLQSAPIQGIARPLKVSKEEIIGLLTALECWVKQDHAAEMAAAKRRTQRLVDSLDGVDGATAEYRFPDQAGRPYPTCRVRLDPERGVTAAEVIAALLAGSPSVAVMHADDPYLIRVDVRVLSDADAEIVATRLREVLQTLLVGHLQPQLA
jgi:L-seryl-tRNA(Ser) seleniumtransferase